MNCLVASRGLYVRLMRIMAREVTLNVKMRILGCLSSQNILVVDDPSWQRSIVSDTTYSRDFQGYPSLSNRGMMTSSNRNIFRVTGSLCQVNSPRKGQWRRAMMFSLICAIYALLGLNEIIILIFVWIVQLIYALTMRTTLSSVQYITIGTKGTFFNIYGIAKYCYLGVECS